MASRNLRKLSNKIKGIPKHVPTKLRAQNSLTKLPTSFLPSRGFTDIGHNQIRDIMETKLMEEVCKYVRTEPKLNAQSGETLRLKSTNTQPDEMIDISALEIWNDIELTFFDIRTSHEVHIS